MPRYPEDDPRVPCCAECAYPGHPGVCVRRGFCTCHTMPLPIESD